VTLLAKDHHDVAGSQLLPAPKGGDPFGTRSAPASFGQGRAWFLDRVEANSGLYTIPVALRLTGELDVGALRVR